MLWLLDRWTDVLSDLSVFHRMSPADVDSMPAPLVFDRATKLVYYAGAVQALALKAFRKDEAERPAAPVVAAEATADQVRALRDAARRRKFGAEFGAHKYVSLEAFMGVASGG